MGVAPLALIAALAWFLATTESSQPSATVTVTAPSSTTATTAAQPTDPKVVAGGYDFVEFGCDACHGLRGQGGVSPDVPALANLGNSLSAVRLKQIIDHGLGVVSNPKKPYMPVWGAVISSSQAADLAAYVRAGLPSINGAVPREVPSGASPAARGAAVFENDGCIDCHGPNALGGVPNPSSPDHSIPPLSGADFRHQFNTPAKILQVIRDGSVIGRAPIVSMPHWGGIIPKRDLDALVAYIVTLR